VLEIRGLTKVFNDSKTSEKVLDNVSFSVEDGSIFGFVGANGAGKTTTMGLAMGVTSTTEGSVYLDGVQIAGKGTIEEEAAKARHQIGYMPSERGLYPKMKVGEQLEFFAQLHGISAKEAHEQVERLLKELNVDKYKNQALNELSTGNMQRVQLIAALVGHPKALILDEPFSELDPIAVKQMSASLRKMAEKGIAIIFSSHQLELIDQLCDKVGIIKNGKMIHVGTPEQLRTIAGASQTITIPTPLSDIFGDLVEEVES